MNRKLAIIIGLQAFLIVILFWVLVFYGKDEYEALTQESEEEIETPSRVVSQQGQTIITLSPAAQAQSDITTSPLKAANHQASMTSYGNVISIDSLIDLRSRYIAAKAEAEVQRATIANSKTDYNRLSELNKDDKNVSDKAVATALADIKSNEARVYAAEANARNIADSMRQTWGEYLTNAAIDKSDRNLLQDLAGYKQVLIQIALPFDAAEPKPGSSIIIAPTASPSHTVQAFFVSAAPLSNATVQGKTYFYRAKAANLRAGMQVNAQISQSKTQTSGVIIPNNAVVWYGGKPWVYRKQGQEQFSRLPINADIETDQGWFYKGNLKPNDQVVTSGAQLLLSEEFKYQITNENED